MVSAMAAAERETVYQGDSQETDIGLIPSDWDVEELGNIGSAFIGLTYSPRDVHTDGTLVLRSSNVQNGRLRFDDNVYVNVDVPDRATVRENDILICVRNGSRDLIGKSAVIDAPSAGMAFGAFMGLYRSEHNSFLAHVFKSDIVMRQIHEHLGATINQITNKSLNGFKSPLPKNPDERKAISEALSDADALIESLEQLIAKKRAIKQGAMQELLTGKRRLEGFQTSSDFKKTEIVEIPEDWQIVSIADIGFVGRGRVISHKEISRSNDPKYPVYSSQTSNNGIMGYLDTYEFEGKYITWTTDGANAGTVFARDGKFNCTNVCGTIKIQNHVPEFIALIISKFAPSHVSRHLGNPKLMNDVMKKIQIPIPSNTDEQRAVFELISNMELEIEGLSSKLSKARYIKQGMMQELLNGRIRLV